MLLCALRVWSRPGPIGTGPARALIYEPPFVWFGSAPAAAYNVVWSRQWARHDGRVCVYVRTRNLVSYMRSRYILYMYTFICIIRIRESVFVDIPPVYMVYSTINVRIVRI